MKAADYTILATSERYRDVAAFWRRQLGDLESVTDALDRPREPAAGSRQSIDVPLGPAARAALARLAGDGLGRFTAATAGIALALIRYLNRPGVLLRSPLLPDEAPPALNGTHDVPLVLTAAGELTLRQFLQHAAAVVEESYSRQDFPIQMLSEREHGADLAALVEFSVSSEPVHGATAWPPSAVHFNLDELDHGRLTIDVDRSRVDEAFASAMGAVVQRTLDHFETLSTRVNEIERVPAEQLPQLTTAWNDTDDDRGFRSVVGLFDEAASRAPDATALRFGEAAVSYRELQERSNRLAHYLIETGHDAAPIGIWMDRSPWMVVAVLGVLKAGLAYVPIDADCPLERLAFMIRDAGLARVLVDEARATTPLLCEVIAADREMPGAAGNPPVEIAPADLAYVIYTSGSTGRPKGCAIEHHSLSNYLRWAGDYYWTSSDTGSMGLFTPLSFDLTVPSLFCPLLRGRTLVVYPQAMGIDELLRRQFAPGSTVDSVKLTPSHIRVLEALRPKSTDVRLIIVGGETLTAQQVASVRRIDPRIRIVNEYGPTEATVGCIVKDIAAGEPITIGRPIANMRAYVLDDAQRPVAIGVRGEICVGGAGVARGYHARPELDAARFLPDPCVPGGRLYRTGDVGRWLPDGELECLGRMDDQLKVRGYRVEPGEIETALRGAHGVTEAVVVGHEGQLVAFVESMGDVDQGALRAMLGQALPAYVVPAAIVRVARLPLTANGKIDRARLPLHLTRAHGRPSGTPPRTERERVLGRIWEEVLRVDRIGVDENFFALGGHSLRAMAMMRRIHEALGLDTSIGEILANPTIAALASALASKTPVETPRIERLPEAGHYAVSHGQRRLWLIDRIDEDSPAYNISSAFDVRGPLNRDALADAFNALVARHESLRTVFVEVDDEPRQRVLDELRLPVDHVDLRADARADERVRGLVAAQASRPFDLRRGPLLRVSVFQTDDDRSVLALTIHHIVSDEWSMRVLIAEAVQLYARAISGGATSLSPLPMQYRDYAAWQQTRLSDDALEVHRRYWLAKLAPPVTSLHLPADDARPAVPTSRGRHHRVRMGAETRAKIRTLGATRGASPFMALVAIVKVLLYRLTGELDIWVGSPIAGRTHPDLAHQIGFYVNTLVLRDTLDGDETFEALLDKVRRTAEEAYAHQAMPFDRLVEEVGAARDLSRSPLFDVMVSYESDIDGVPATAGVEVEEIKLDSGVSKFDLTFAFAESERGIDVEVEFSTDLFSQERIERMSAQLVRLAESIVAAPDIS
ncbi:MAG: amino acid adenylation domain-containing protein, partial [Acidobacteria bacterium]|nr:amino acid adenylation domain-containing protein [Acidobacteriota bacterium]